MGLGDALLFRVGLDLGPVETGLRGLRSRLSSFGSGAVGAVGFAALTAGAAALGHGFLQAGSEMETFESRLSTLMGSSTAARARMEELYEFAATTPFNTAQIVGAEVTLRGFGAAAEEIMPGLIDFASVTGTDLTQAAIDLGKAWNQGAAGMESDGARILRAELELREGTDAAKMSLEDFREALLETLDEGQFAGGAIRMSRTFAGLASNLIDEWSAFQRTVAKAGVFNEVKSLLIGILDLIHDNKAGAEEWAAVLSDGVWTAIKGIGYTAAGVVDIFRGWGMLIEVAKIGFWGLVDAELAAVAAASQITGQIATWAGNAQLAAKAADTLTAAIAGRGAAQQLASNAGDVLISMSGAASATQTFANLLNEAGLRAGSLADEIERGAKGPSATAGGRGDGEKVDGGWEGLIEEQERMLEAGKDFTAEMMSLDDTRTEAALANMDARIAANTALWAQDSLDTETALANQLAIEKDYAAEVAAIYAAEEERRIRAHDEEMRRIQDEGRERVSVALSVASSVGDITRSLSEAVQGEGEKAKELRKGLAISAVLIDAAVASIRAYADLGPIAGAVAIAGIEVSAGLAIREIRAQHQGGVVYAHQGRYPDEYDTGNVRRLRQEATLNSQATRRLGEQGVAALNGGGSVTTVVNLRINRASQQEVVRGSLAPNGATWSALRTSPSQGGLDVGLSGDRAVA